MPIQTNSLMYRLQLCQCACGWSGNGSEATFGEHTRYYFDLHCPLCDEEVALVGLLTSEEFVRLGQEHWERLGEEERSEVRSLMRAITNYESRKLTRANRLPEIDEETFTLDWDQFGDETMIYLANRLIWREPVVYEGSQRFAEIAQLLSSYYGPRLLDLRPSEKSLLYLLGDDLRAPAKIESCRRELFGPQRAKIEEP